MFISLIVLGFATSEQNRNRFKTRESILLGNEFRRTNIYIYGHFSLPESFPFKLELATVCLTSPQTSYVDQLLRDQSATFLEQLE